MCEELVRYFSPLISSIPAFKFISLSGSSLLRAVTISSQCPSIARSHRSTSSSCASPSEVCLVLQRLPRPRRDSEQGSFPVTIYEMGEPRWLFFFSIQEAKERALAMLGLESQHIENVLVEEPETPGMFLTQPSPLPEQKNRSSTKTTSSSTTTKSSSHSSSKPLLFVALLFVLLAIVAALVLRRP